MVLSKVLCETTGDVSLCYKELLERESWSLIEAIVIFLGKPYFERAEASKFLKENEFSQAILQLAFDSIMAKSLKASQFENDFYVVPDIFIKWWASKGLSFPEEIKELSHILKTIPKSTQTVRNNVNIAKKKMKETAKRIWLKNPYWTAEQVIEAPEIKKVIDELNGKGKKYKEKTYRSWISKECNPKPEHQRLGRPKKELK